MSDPLSLAIKGEARRLGFALAGITTPDMPPHCSTFEQWLAMGRHGQMDYMASERARACRSNPLQILPGCHSIIMLGIGYPNPAPVTSTLDQGAVRGVASVDGLPEDIDIRGRVAAYALGIDYHLVLPERLRGLVEFIESCVGHTIRSCWYSDSGPVLERDLAQRAGLGWIGKNTCLINPRLGSYFLLAEILIDIDLQPDLPFAADHCGSCSRCIRACPTQCILPDRTLDARRCISYLTIELKEAIPLELRPLLGEWVFGCDICQMVCPWNRFAAEKGDAVFEPRSSGVYPDLVSELNLTPETFNRKYEASPVKRAKRRGYLRNVSVALGNVRDYRAVPTLRKAINDPERLVREHAAWALEQITGGG